MWDKVYTMFENNFELLGAMVVMLMLLNSYLHVTDHVTACGRTPKCSLLRPDITKNLFNRHVINMNNSLYCSDRDQ
jgi:hypothetical protein